MKNKKEELPENPDQSAIINKDTEFENESLDPAFVFETGQEDQDEKAREAFKQDEQGTQQINPG